LGLREILIRSLQEGGGEQTKLNGEINQLRNAVYNHIGGWSAPEAPTEAD
jgi:hypothetical protein